MYVYIQSTDSLTMIFPSLTLFIFYSSFVSTLPRTNGVLLQHLLYLLNIIASKHQVCYCPLNSKWYREGAGINVRHPSCFNKVVFPIASRMFAL